MSYTTMGDGIGVEFAIPWSEVEVQAFEAFLTLSPRERTAALAWLEISSGNRGMLAFCENQDTEKQDDN